jgi:hypothetical protein
MSEASSRRRITRLTNIIEKMKETATSTRTHYGHVVAKHVNNERNLREELSQAKDQLIKDAFQLQDLKDKEAVQAQMIGQLGQDNKELIEKFRRNVETGKRISKQRDDAMDALESVRAQLAIAEMRISYRLYLYVVDKLKIWGESFGSANNAFRERLRVTWMILRLALQNERVQALDAAYQNDPAKAARIAKEYWDWDKKNSK